MVIIIDVAYVSSYHYVTVHKPIQSFNQFPQSQKAQKRWDEGHAMRGLIAPSYQFCGVTGFASIIKIAATYQYPCNCDERAASPICGALRVPLYESTLLFHGRNLP
jgi:hypothetical protein